MSFRVAVSGSSIAVGGDGDIGEVSTANGESSRYPRGELVLLIDAGHARELEGGGVMICKWIWMHPQLHRELQQRLRVS